MQSAAGRDEQLKALLAFVDQRNWLRYTVPYPDAYELGSVVLSLYQRLN